MTNHEQAIILRWLIAERERVGREYDREREDGDRSEADDLFRQKIWLSEQYDRVSERDTGRVVLTDAERNAQAAGVLGKMGNGVA
jgi:hypothetical protein